MAGSNNNDSTEVHFQQGSCTIILKQGDLLNENDVDMIVIPTPECGQQSSHTYPLFEALWSRADQNLKGQIKTQSAKVKTGGAPQIIWTPKPTIILTPTPYFGNERKALQMLKDTYLTCLNLAVKEKSKTIAFPTIGCGKSGFKSFDAATVLYDALTRFEQTRETQLQEIRIIIYDKDIYEGFIDVFMESSQHKNAKIKLTDISSKKSNPSEMPSKKDEKRTAERQSQKKEEDDYADDFENETGNERERARKPASNLNPETPEYRPGSNYQRRDLRRYFVNNDRTELHIVQGDILTTKVDAIVNAANESMLGGGGVDGVIHRAAGDELRRACKAHKEIYRDVRLPIGRSRILLSYNMSKTTHYIINTSGPRYDDAPPEKCKEDLISCYKTSLALANLYDLETIGYTAISCGIFGYPIDEGAEVALTTVNKNAGSMSKILFVLKDDDIYDAWVMKAEELQFTSLDGSGARVTNPPKQPTSDTRKITEKPSPTDESDVPKQSSGMTVIDGSTHDSTGKPVASDHEDPENKSSNPNKNTDSPEPVEHEGAASAPNKNDETKEKKSGQKTTDNQEQEQTSNNSSKQKQAQSKDQKPDPPPARKDTKKSIISGAVGRGKLKK